MQRVDKETLWSIHQDIIDLLNEAKTILQMEAPREVAARALTTWVEDIDRALGENGYSDPFSPTFWQTLEELNILTADGQLVEKLQDDKEDDCQEDDCQDQIDSLINEGGISIENNQMILEDDYEDDEAFVETVYVVDENQELSQELKSSSDRVVEENLQSSGGLEQTIKDNKQLEDDTNWSKYCSGVWYDD